jgi:methionyl-tRNA synthetase
MPGIPAKIREQLGINDENLTSWESVRRFGVLPAGLKVGDKKIIFPRIEEPVEIKTAEEKSKGQQVHITIDDFAKVDLRVAEVLEASRIEGADKLLKLKVRIGEETRQIVAGIAKHYSPEQLIGKKIVVVANLKPTKLRGVESQGMLLAASSKEKVVLVTVDEDIEAGAKVK